VLNPALETRSPRSFRRAIASVALACGLLGAPAAVMLANATHAVAEVAPPDCYDDPNGPGCSGGGGGGDNGGTGTGEAGGGSKGGGHTGVTYRTAITDNDVAGVSGMQLALTYEADEWRSYNDWLRAAGTYWNDNYADAATMVGPGTPNVFVQVCSCNGTFVLEVTQLP
jgi:hypothetical protein